MAAIRQRVAGRQSASPGPGVQGTMGGPAQPAPQQKPVGGRDVVLGDEVYLWILIAVELALMTWLRVTFSRYHGG